jgi:hypothetical protein
MNTETITPSQAEAMEDHGHQQAKAQAASISAMVAALQCDYDRLDELRAERADLAETLADQEHPKEIRAAMDALACWDDANAEELNTLEHEAGDCENYDEALQTIEQDPLSVETRSGWTSIGDTMSAEEFRIVLCTGGPHVEIRGEFDIHGNPYRAWMQYQDWGTPLTQFFDVEESTLLTYCRQFCFGA